MGHVWHNDHPDDKVMKNENNKMPKMYNNINNDHHRSSGNQN
jgi:hypothetical protein